MSSPFAHASIGLFSKSAAPKAPLWALIAATQVPDLLFFVFEAAGIEHPAETQTRLSRGLTYLSPGQIQWSHGLVMCLVWSVVTGLIAYLFLRDRRASAVVGGMVFSHWLLDLQQPPALLLGVAYDRSGAYHVRSGLCGGHRHGGRPDRGRSRRPYRRSAARHGPGAGERQMNRPSGHGKRTAG